MKRPLDTEEKDRPVCTNHVKSANVNCKCKYTYIQNAFNILSIYDPFTITLQPKTVKIKGVEKPCDWQCVPTTTTLIFEYICSYCYQCPCVRLSAKGGLGM